MSSCDDNRTQAQGASTLDELIREVSDHLQFNLDAYGKVWTGEDEDTAFICRPLLREVERLRSSLQRIANLSMPYRDLSRSAQHIAREALREETREQQ